MSTVIAPEINFKNLDKVFWPEEGFTKGNLLNFYLEIGTFLLPHLYHRPMTLKRYPDGIRGKSFYQKNYPSYAPSWVAGIDVPAEKEGHKKMVYIDRLETMLWMVNLGCIEFHPWLSRIENLHQPDVFIFDLDPSPPAGFKDTLPVAVLIHDLLQEYRLESYAKTSGSDGLHIYIPIQPRYDYETIRNALQLFCKVLNEFLPHQVTIALPKAKRDGRVYLDYLQNGYAKTTASVYSVRPEPQAPVSTPLRWEEVKIGDLHPQEFTIKNIPRRLRKYGDLFLPVSQNGQDLDCFIQAMAKN